MARFPEKALARIFNGCANGMADSYRLRQILYRMHRALLVDAEECKRHAAGCVRNYHPNGAGFWQECEAKSRRRAEAVLALYRAW